MSRPKGWIGLATLCGAGARLWLPAARCIGVARKA